MSCSYLRHSRMARVNEGSQFYLPSYTFIHNWNEPHLPLLPSRRALPNCLLLISRAAEIIFAALNLRTLWRYITDVNKDLTYKAKDFTFKAKPRTYVARNNNGAYAFYVRLFQYCELFVVRRLIKCFF